VRLLGCLRDTRLRWRTGLGLHRTALIAGLIGVTAGAAVLTAAPARAVNVTQPDALGLTTASGAARLQPRWYTQDECPSGFQGSAVLYELNSDGSIGSRISPVVTDVNAPFGGTLLGPVGQLITRGTDVGDGGTSEWVVGCFAGSGGQGSVDYLQSLWVTLSADGGSFWTRIPRPVATTLTLTASPNPAAAGAAVTLTATVKAADGTIPHGEVAFLAGLTLISVASVNASGVATATTMFAASGTQPRTLALSAWFFGLIGAYAGSIARYSETVDPAAGSAGNGQPITVTVPRTGAFVVTITPGTVILTAPNRTGATGTLQDVTVIDRRDCRPGWSVSGQDSVFTGSGIAAGATIPADQLGWAPSVMPAGRGVSPGPAVPPAGPGLGTTAAILGFAEEGRGFGTYVLTALLSLVIPPTTPGGPYAGSLTITAVESAP
jgi:hypothetical protein